MTMNKKWIIGILLILIITIVLAVERPVEEVISEERPVAYGESYFHSYATPIVIPILITDLYYNLTGLTELHSKNVTFTGHGANILIEGHYTINSGISFSGGNGGIYEFEVFVDNISQENCAFFRSSTSSAIGHASITCILSLNESQHVDLRIKDISNPPKSVNIHQANLNINLIDKETN